jgi:hypothetical protein
MEMARIAYTPGFSPRKFAFAIALSISLHLLLVWHLSQWYKAGWTNLPTSSVQPHLHITITTPKTQETEHQQPPLSEAATGQSPEEKPLPMKEPIDRAEVETTPTQAPTPKPTTTGSIEERPVTTAQIKQSATAVIRELADDDTGEQEQRPDSTSAILERALNKPRETPGIYSQMDGTTRVVTEQGFTYCVKPLDDWRIIDPEDDMRVSVYCQ